MSLVQDLASRLRATRDGLPVAEIAGAAERLRTATGLLARVTHQSARPADAPSLGSAAGHLDHAAAALRLAQDALDAYCMTLGMAGESYPDTRGWTVPNQRTERIDAQLSTWWADRVAQLSGYSSYSADKSVDDAANSSGDLLQRCVAAALDRDTEHLAHHLTSAGPAVGLGLAAISPRLLRQLGTELVGHPPRLEDLAQVRKHALPFVTNVLPALPVEAAEGILARVCHARVQNEPTQPAHPVDVAVGSALLVAGLLKAGHRTADDLSNVVTQEHASQPGLRITDSTRHTHRRSAVDELRPAAP